MKPARKFISDFKEKIGETKNRENQKKRWRDLGERKTPKSCKTDSKLKILK
jgi:hypothetical protein